MRMRLCRCGGVREDRQGSVCGKCGAGKSKSKQKTHEAGYGWDWQQLRKLYWECNPVCEECERQGRPTIEADEVHHIIPIAEAPWLRLEWSNLMSLCVPCHRRIDEARRRVSG